MDASFARDLDALSERALELTNKLLDATYTLSNSGDVKGKRKMRDQDDVVDKFQSVVVDSMDQLLERSVSVPFQLSRNVAQLVLGYLLRSCSWKDEAACNSG